MFSSDISDLYNDAIYQWVIGGLLKESIYS